MSHNSHHNSNSLSSKIESLISLSTAQCYQCGKCSAGCPIRDYMDDAPNQVIRYVQLGFDDKALKSNTQWLCAGCLTCSSRCPQNFDIAKFMDAMRQLALEAGVKIEEKDTVNFHEAFLNQIKRFGRAYEAGLTVEYKLKTLNLMQDMDVAPEMFMKGKIGLLPHTVKDKESIRKIFDNID